MRILPIFLLLSCIYYSQVVANTTESVVLKAVFPFQRLSIQLSSPTIVLDDLLTLIYRDLALSRKVIVIKFVESLPESGVNLELLKLKGGERVIVNGTDARRIQVNVLTGVPLDDVLNFILVQVFQDPPERFASIQTDVSTKRWTAVDDFLTARRIKTDRLWTFFDEEQRLLALIQATGPTAVWVRRLEDFGKMNTTLELSDSFYRNSLVQNLNLLFIRSTSIVSQITDEALLGMKAIALGMAAAPKITLAGVQRFLQPAIDGKADKLALRLKPSFQFDERSFFKELKMQSVNPLGDDPNIYSAVVNGTKVRFEVYYDFSDFYTVTLSVCRESALCGRL